MNIGIPIIFSLVSFGLVFLGLRELIQQGTVAYKKKLG